MNSIIEIEQDELFEELLDNKPFVFLGSLNFEECSVQFLSSMLSKNMGHKVRCSFNNIRLESHRAGPWSALEIVKNKLESEVEDLAKQTKQVVHTIKVEFPVSFANAKNLLWELYDNFGKGAPRLVLDISCFPREFTFYILELLFSSQEAPKFEGVYVVITPPGTTSERKSISPFSVGIPKHLNGRTNLANSKVRTTALIFPGDEGFEAQSVVDTIIGANSDIFVALDCESYSFPDSISTAVANQTLISSWQRDEIHIKHYFSTVDLLRVGEEIIEFSKKKIDQYPEERHQLLVAPFGSKRSLLMGSCIIAAYKNIKTTASVDADILVLPHYQYISLYSRGWKSSRVFKLES